MAMDQDNLCMPFDRYAPLGPNIPKDAPDPVAGSHAGKTDGHISIESALLQASDPSATVVVALVDSYAFTRGCLIQALTLPKRGIAIRSFETLTELARHGTRDIDVVLFYDHDRMSGGWPGTPDESTLPQELADIPVIVLSDAETALEAQTVRAALKRGLRGFISTRTSEMKTVSAAIHFVKAGGVFAPVELLLAGESVHSQAGDEAVPPAGLLTARQITVLTLLRQGKANKIIAYELGMSESTVKVHIRNIMRKMGATNRTQAIYKLQHFAPG